MRWRLLLVIPPLLWALLPAIDALRRPRIEILLDQLAGSGCQFQPHARSLNPLTTCAIRHPEYACPIWAAEQLAGTPAASWPPSTPLFAACPPPSTPATASSLSPPN